MQTTKTNTYIFVTEYMLEQPIPVTCYFIAESISKTDTVIFVEKAASFLGLVTDNNARNKIMRSGSVTQISNNFFVYVPYPRLPFDRVCHLFSIFNQYKLKFEINSIRRKFRLNHSSTFLISFNYNSSIVLQGLRNYMKTVYYILDDWKEFTFPFGSKKLVEKENNLTTKAADLVVTVSEQLALDAKVNNAFVTVIKNGVDISQYEHLDDVELQDLCKYDRPIIGFVGTIESWVDISLIEFLAKNISTAEFVIIGPSFVDMSPLDNLSNVHLLGPKPKKLVPNYISKMQIGIIPFKINNLSKSVSPLKLYEYLAAGIPVVSTPMDGSMGMEQYDVFIEDSHVDFLERVRSIISEYGTYESRRSIRVEFARENSWDSRAKELLEFISNTRK